MLRRVAVLGFALATIGLLPVSAASQERRAATETALHAAFVYNFAKFVDWEGAGSAGPLRFCVLGDEAVEEALGQLVVGSSVQGRLATVVRDVNRNQLSACHVLYVGDVTVGGEAFLNDLSRRPVLTVGNGKGFAERGGMIGLFVEGGHMQFAVNLNLTRRAGITLSSQLLSLATIVGDE
jgi:hypothetical protein